MGSKDKSAAMAMIAQINAVEGFDPSALAVEYVDMNTGEKWMRLPVISQIAWFRLKYPEGRFTINVTPGKDCFVATARVYKHHTDPIEFYLAEASAAKGQHPTKPSVSAREWAQTAALGIALRNAGFGLQFHTAGEALDEPAVNELISDAQGASVDNTQPGNSEAAVNPVPAPPEEDPFEAAMKMPCPVSKYQGKTLGDLLSIDPKAIVWVAQKFTGNSALSEAARLICERSLAATA